MRSKRVRVLGRLGVAAAALLLVAAQGASAAPPPRTASRPAPTRAPQVEGATHLRLPKGLSTAPVQVMVQLAADPVTVADANTDQTMSASQKQQVKNSLKAQQAPVAARIQALGGKVTKSYQSAYNGLRVTIASDKLVDLSAIAGVAGVHAITPKAIDNVHGVPLIGAPQVWDGVNGLHGEGIKIADIDTGIDYTHADLAGPGTVQAYQDALANDTTAADPSMFGPGAPRVKGGTDLV
ncbi:MAG TPA: hypothetical protein VGF22_17920, partial [Acidimicrobiales bacterium]